MFTIFFFFLSLDVESNELNYLCKITTAKKVIRIETETTGTEKWMWGKTTFKNLNEMKVSITNFTILYFINFILFIAPWNYDLNIFTYEQMCRYRCRYLSVRRHEHWLNLFEFFISFFFFALPINAARLQFAISLCVVSTVLLRLIFNVSLNLKTHYSERIRRSNWFKFV